VTKTILISVPWLALTVGAFGCRLFTGVWPAWPALLGLTGLAAAASSAIGLDRVLNVLRAGTEQRSFEAGRLYEAATRSAQPLALLEAQRPAAPPDAVIAHWRPRGRLGTYRGPHRPGERGGPVDRRSRPADPTI
jgi:hypothetical protein